MDLHEKLEDYLLAHTSKEDDILYQLNRETHTSVLHPRMLSGQFQGKFLEMISRMVQPLNILEIGTYTGYSAICLAKGLREGGTLDTIEINDELEGIADKYIKMAGLNDRVTMHFGNALEIIPRLEKTYDLVFIDAEKTEYEQYYHMVMGKIPSNAYILADNVLWSGKVLTYIQDDDDQTRAIVQFNDMVQKDPRVDNIMLPVRDGLMLARKL